MSFHVIGLSIEGFRRIEAALIPLGPGLNEVTGSNRAGKTSALRGLWAALGGGADAWGAVPIHTGRTMATVSLTVADRAAKTHCTIDLEFAQASDPKLIVRGADGKRIGAAATFIRGLVGAGIAWDPTAFAWPNGEVTAEGRNKRRTEILLRACPLSIDLGVHEARRDAIFRERRDVARDAKALAAAVPPEPEADETVPERVDAAALRADLQVLRAENAKTATARTERARIEDRVSTAGARVLQLERELAEAKRASVAAGLALEEHFGAWGATIADKDTAPIESQIAAAAESVRLASLAEQRNEQRKIARAARERAEGAAVEKACRAEELTKQIEAMDLEKATAIAEAQLPAGLTIGPDSVPYLDGLPFEEAAESTRLLAALNVGKALCGPLRLLTLPDGDKLDAESMIALRDWCDAEGVQVVTERLTAVEGVDGCEIVEGRVAP